MKSIISKNPNLSSLCTLRRTSSARVMLLSAIPLLAPFHASLAAVSDLSSSQALSLSVTIASSSSCLGCQRFLCHELGFYSLVAIAERKRREKLSQRFIALSALPVKVSKESSYSSDDSDEEEEKPSKTPQKSAKDVEMVDADSAKKVSKTPSTPSVATGGSKTLFVGNLVFFSYDVMLLLFSEEFFKDCGEVVDVRFSVDDTGRFKRFRHVEFSIAEAAQSALELNEHELLNHPVRLDLARERGSYIPGGSNSFQKGDQRQTGQTIFIRGFDKFLGGRSRGFAYIDFKDFSSMKKALELNETELAGGYYLSVEDRVLRMRTCSIYFLLMMMKSSAFKYHVDFWLSLLVMVVDAEAYTYDNEVIKKAEAMGKPKNPEEEATVETTRAIKHHQES
ncbi:hypothetical protein Ahy_A04g020915 isoform A [Arachis hypogaea]|uniref:RRM domain-containing protein n=1 Tax=Arachis hypogaea TaxID=3818 RepID=A0A445DJ34_ARAHY|nr:hypothetical protein Ahy_A04g020915 isoform A [Arachis hypogaea]